MNATWWYKRAHTLTLTHKVYPHPRLIPIMSLLIRVLGEQSCQRNPIISQMMESFTVDEHRRWSTWLPIWIHQLFSILGKLYTCEKHSDNMFSKLPKDNPVGLCTVWTHLTTCLTCQLYRVVGIPQPYKKSWVSVVTWWTLRDNWVKWIFLEEVFNMDRLSPNNKIGSLAMPSKTTHMLHKLYIWVLTNQHHV